MTIHARKPGLSSTAKRSVSIQQLTEWAFRKECVQLDLPYQRPVDERGFGFGMEYVLIQQARLGVSIDKSPGKSYPHEDAEVVAAILAHLPDVVGGRRMAIRIAEHARAGNTPDWMPGAIPRLEPLEWQDKWWGTRGKSEVLETVTVKYRREKVTREVRWTPCRWVPSQECIRAARDTYGKWWIALHELREQIRLSGMMRCHELTDAMPAATPWGTKG